MKICFLIISRCPLSLFLTPKILLFVLKSTWFDIDVATLAFYMDSFFPIFLLLIFLYLLSLMCFYRQPRVRIFKFSLKTFSFSQNISVMFLLMYSGINLSLYEMLSIGLRCSRFLFLFFPFLSFRLNILHYFIVISLTLLPVSLTYWCLKFSDIYLLFLVNSRTLK